VLDALGIAMVGKASREVIEQGEFGVEFAEQKCAGVGGDSSAAEVGENIACAEVLEGERGGDTLCHDSMALFVCGKCLVVQTLTREGAIGFLLSVRNAG
jgi:hypothetical protein